MKSLQKYEQTLSWIFSLMLLWGMLLLEQARVLPSIGMAGLLLTALLLHGPLAVWKRFTEQRVYWIFSISFFFLLPAILYSQNTAYYFERLQVQLPVIILPLAFASLSPLPARKYHQLLALFVGGVCLVAAVALINYFLHFDAINELYLHSKVIPNPLRINHVRFSLMLSISIFICYYLYGQAYLKKVMLMLGLFLLVFMHIYSVRSGMLGFYAGAFMLIVYRFVIRDKKYLQGGLVLLALCLLPVLALLFSPTLRNKTLNTTGDLQRWRQGENANNYPMSTRFVSYQVALDIASYNPWIGCGLGDLEQEIQRNYLLYHSNIAHENRIIPHNQFLYYYAGTGIIGLCIFIASFFYPLLYCYRHKIFLALIQYINISLSFMVEPTLETQLGVALAVTFILLPLWQHKSPQADVR